MKLIEQDCGLVRPQSYQEILEKVEMMGRLCYKSEDKIKDGSAEKFITGIIKSGHESVIEHASMTMRFVTNRAMTHQIVRHRLCNFSQESQRYCNYANDKFNSEVTFIKPLWYDGLEPGSKEIVNNMFKDAEENYKALVDAGFAAEQARDILPNACKTEIGVTANMREWRHIFKVRCLGHADPMIKDLMGKALKMAVAVYPVFFMDIYEQFTKENETHK